MRRYYLCLLWLMLASMKEMHAQENKSWSGFGVETNVMVGKILKHTGKIKAPIPPVSTAIDFNFTQQTFGKKDWHIRRGFPMVGVGVTFSNYGGVYGACVGVYPNLLLPIVKGEQMEWTARVGYGFSYATKPYSRVPQPDTFNNAIGSHFNNYTLFATDLRYHVNKHWDVQIGAHFTHISNAALRLPNYGINMYGAHLGLRYFPVTAQPSFQRRTLPKLRNRWLAQLRAGIAWNEYAAIDGPIYPVYMASALVSKRYASKNKAFAGLDYSFHPATVAFQKNNEINVGKERQNSWKSAVFVGNEFLLGRVGILLQVGWYLKHSVLRGDLYYQKLGSNFYLLQNEKGVFKEIALGMFLKTHKAQAELGEFALGVSF